MKMIYWKPDITSLNGLQLKNYLNNGHKNRYCSPGHPQIMIQIDAQGAFRMYLLGAGSGGRMRALQWYVVEQKQCVVRG
jgi:hypothetical protein